MSKIRSALKRFYSCFLFAKRTEDHKALFIIWNLFFIAGSGVGLGVLSLMLSFGNYPWQMFGGYFSHPVIALLNILPPLLLVVFLYCLIGRAWIAYLISAFLILGPSVGNYYKLAFRDDPFIAADLSDIAIGMKFGSRYGLFLNGRIVFCAVCALAVTLFLAFFVRGRFKARFRLPVAAIVLIVCVFPLRGVYEDKKLYSSISNTDYPKANVWSSTQQYVSKGFVYPFLHSIRDAVPQKPEGYSEDKAKEILSAYTREDIPEERKVNLICIQLEAFSDFSRMGVEGIDGSVYEKYHALEAESYTGRLVTDIFAGGTVRTERSFVTGYFKADDFRRDTGSYVRYLKEQGYFTEGGHPCYDWYYNRRNINEYIGFDRYWYFENRYSSFYGLPTAPDSVFMPDVLELYRQRDPSVPYFNFSVSYQGHGPYYSDNLDFRGDGYWRGDRTDSETYFVMNNYLGLIKDTCENLEKLVDSLRSDDAPVVLVLFGDHKPWLGNSNSVYEALGINLDTSEEEGFYNYYSTRYLIWANDPAKEILGDGFSEEGPDVSPCFLMNVLFDRCGWGGGPEYMQFMSDLMQKSGVISKAGYCTEGGVFSREPSEELSELIGRSKIIQYFRKRNPEW